MAVALLPIVILSAFQAQADFQNQADDRRVDLELAAERSASQAASKLNSAQTMLRVLSPEALGVYCEPRLTELVQRLEGYDGLYRLSPTGAPVCASTPKGSTGVPRIGQAGRQTWFQRLAAGEETVVTRASHSDVHEPALIVAERVETARGDFAGAMAAVLPISSLQPDIDDPAMPAGAQAALTDAQGRILTSTLPSAFSFGGRSSIEGWVDRARQGGASVFEAVDRGGERRVYAGAALYGRDVYVLLTAPAPGLLSWAQLNPIGIFLLPLAAWFTAFAAVMLFSERIVIRWLDYLERVAAIYARGRFSVRPVQAVHAPAEIRVLARTLDELADTITTRDAALVAALDEKDGLLREIHHRVKNNLQIISSLLSMQQRTLTDAPAKSALADTRHRISALALIYRTLYQGADIRHADAREFLTELVGQLVSAEASRGPVVISHVEADSLQVDPDRLAPLALWLVEAVSNAQKHAFAGRGGRLDVRFKVNGDTSVLEVQDDGPGLEAARAGLGQTLMSAFAKQLRGEAELIAAPGGGVIARMTFATPEAAPISAPGQFEISRNLT
ncbi:sensor histidine kinase [Brevundimonas sp. S30B]|uniref:sensor histidine kinase PhyK n=1 Tax=unclassified Brevundimonas TaxID=2622653 RepID=UPI001072BBBA|nr:MULTISPECIES: sensor histidine kinase [unclassified Brevundimonas]QBX36790.1 sensor histidine kinase [Brevundimonas sp. MF30-B]TFW04415.1 sensor histidine kinase [Brevundimonas sp. S30B]